jgi:hypothetical protein
MGTHLLGLLRLTARGEGARLVPGAPVATVHLGASFTVLAEVEEEVPGDTRTAAASAAVPSLRHRPNRVEPRAGTTRRPDHLDQSTAAR